MVVSGAMLFIYVIYDIGNHILLLSLFLHSLTLTQLYLMVYCFRDIPLHLLYLLMKCSQYLSSNPWFVLLWTITIILFSLSHCVLCTYIFIERFTCLNWWINTGWKVKQSRTNRANLKKENSISQSVTITIHNQKILLCYSTIYYIFFKKNWMLYLQ